MFEQYYTGTQIEILYVVTFTLIMLFSVLAYTKKMSIGIAIISMITGLGIAWLLAPYMQIALSPLVNWIVYGYVFTWHTGVALAHISTLFIMVGIAGYNLLHSGGKIIWA